MQKPPFFHIGARTMKTALSVAVCLFLFQLLTFSAQYIPQGDRTLFAVLRFLLNRPNPIFACIAGVIAMQPTVDNAVSFGSSRILGTVIGGVTGLAFLWLDHTALGRKLHVLLILTGMILITQLCLLLQRPLAVSIAIITFLVLMITQETVAPYLYAVNRILDTTIGIGISLLINLSVARPKEKNKA